tara:strand:+ start:232 stop:891 length:660 start_codon:yes stop_codon:yes gene_type:complete
MPKLYGSLADDGYIYSQSTSNWQTARDATTGTSVSTTATRAVTAVRAAKAGARGGGTSWTINRSFMLFNCSRVHTVPHNAKLKIKGYVTTGADFFVLKGTQGSSLSTADFDAIDGWSVGSSDGSGAGDNEGNVTKFSDEVTSWSGVSYNTIELNNLALAHMVKNSSLEIALVESVHDLRDIEPSGSNNTGMYYNDYTGTSSDAYIEYMDGTGLWMGANF